MILHPEATFADKMIVDTSRANGPTHRAVQLVQRLFW